MWVQWNFAQTCVLQIFTYIKSDNSIAITELCKQLSKHRYHSNNYWMTTSSFTWDERRPSFTECLKVWRHQQNWARSKMQKWQISRASIVVWVSGGKFSGSKENNDSRNPWIPCVSLHKLCTYVNIIMWSSICTYISLLSFSCFVLYSTIVVYLYVCLHLFICNACFIYCMKD